MKHLKAFDPELNGQNIKMYQPTVSEFDRNLFPSMVTPLTLLKSVKKTYTGSKVIVITARFSEHQLANTYITLKMDLEIKLSAGYINYFR